MHALFVFIYSTAKKQRWKNVYISFCIAFISLCHLFLATNIETVTVF